MIKPLDYESELSLEESEKRLEEVKEVFERVKKDYFKILLNNPKLLTKICFNKPEITYDYFEKSYNKGLEISEILGEKEIIEMTESLSQLNPEIIYDIRDIFTNDEEISKRLTKLSEMNDELRTEAPFDGFKIICAFLYIILFHKYFILKTY